MSDIFNRSNAPNYMHTFGCIDSECWMPDAGFSETCHCYFGLFDFFPELADVSICALHAATELDVAAAQTDRLFQ